MVISLFGHASYLRFLKRKSDINQIMNITGMAILVVGVFIVVWDWAYIWAGFKSPEWLGISHLIIAIWALAIIIKGVKKILEVPIWLGILLSLVWVILGMPCAIFMRGPV